jgi:hypothetical protein
MTLSEKRSGVPHFIKIEESIGTLIALYEVFRSVHVGSVVQAHGNYYGITIIVRLWFREIYWDALSVHVCWARTCRGEPRKRLLHSKGFPATLSRSVSYKSSGASRFQEFLYARVCPINFS